MTFDEFCTGSTLTAEEIAIALDYSPSYISLLRSGGRTPSHAVIQNIFKYSKGLVPFEVWFNHET